MLLSMRACALSCGLLWGGLLLLCGLVNLASASYGFEFLRLMSSVYPGFRGSRDVLDVLVGTAYGLADGALGGLIFAWLYNCFAGRKVRTET